jgi:4-hydroxybenzoate polyprenyltransferase
VPGDPLAGYLLAMLCCGSELKALALISAVGASLCLYCFGLLLNDMVDVQVDLQERPERPLPSGRISFNSARGAAVAFGFTGLNLALFAGLPVLYAAAVLAALIILYNAGFKRLPIVGVVSMGLCRGFSFLLGVMTALPDQGRLYSLSCAPVVLGFIAVTLAFIGISAVARNEMDVEKLLGFQRWLPFAALLISMPAMVVAVSALELGSRMGIMTFIFLMVMTLMRSWLLGGMMYRCQPVPVTVGGQIRNHLMVQASLASLAGGVGLAVAAVLVLASQLFASLSRRFYSS